ncbi:MAG: deoxyribonuclease IV [Candidatus Rokubacteria bacterium]|nr:deoxyribonuclease IV [Candidatus Rokubacteria bacterium]
MRTYDEIGAHMSIAGGLALALERGQALACGAVQVFLKNHRQWAARPMADDDVRLFRATRRATGIRHVFAHASYLVNLATPGPAPWRQAVDAFTDELERAEALGLASVVIHPGSHMGLGVEAGLDRVVAALDEVTARTAGYRVKIALENTAGAGGCLGKSFAELGAMIRRARRPERLGVCIDTCHLFAAGYDIRTDEGWRRATAECAREVGLGRVLAFHLNDAKAGLGSGLDRHEHIGRGFLGLRPFGWLLNDSRFRRVPKVLETPKEPEPLADRRNLAALRRLRPVSAPTSRRRAGTAGAPGRASTSARSACTRSGRT